MDILGPLGDFAGAALGIGSGQSAQGRNIDWQRELAQNAVQFKMTDMKRAGLNPILMMSKGGMGGTAGPAGSAPGQFGPSPMLGTSARQGALISQKVLTEVQETNRVKWDTELIGERLHAVVQQYRLHKATTAKQYLDIGILEQSLKEWKNKGSISATKFGRIMTYIDRIRGPINDAAKFTGQLSHSFGK